MHDDGGLGEGVEDEVEYGSIDPHASRSGAEHDNANVLNAGVGEETFDVVDFDEVDRGDEDGYEACGEDDHLRPGVYGGMGHHGVEAEESDEAGVHDDTGEHGRGRGGCGIFGIDACGEHGEESHLGGVAHEDEYEGHLKPEGVELWGECAEGGEREPDFGVRPHGYGGEEDADIDE